jgi:hypothetical protein
MSKPTIFTISARWNDEASVWSGHSDDIPAAADAPTLDELLAELSAMTLDLLPDNHPEIDPASVCRSSHYEKPNPSVFLVGIRQNAILRQAGLPKAL